MTQPLEELKRKRLDVPGMASWILDALDCLIAIEEQAARARGQEPQEGRGPLCTRRAQGRQRERAFLCAEGRSQLRSSGSEARGRILAA